MTAFLVSFQVTIGAKCHSTAVEVACMRFCMLLMDMFSKNASNISIPVSYITRHVFPTYFRSDGQRPVQGQSFSGQKTLRSFLFLLGLGCEAGSLRRELVSGWGSGVYCEPGVNPG